MCPNCGGEQGLHVQGCDLLTQGFDELTHKKHVKLQEAILAAGYEPLIIVGFGVRPNGSFSLKVGAHSVVRKVSNEVWEEIREVLDRALDRIRELPMDDLDTVVP